MAQTPTPPAPVKPERLIVLETEGWSELDASSKAAFEMVLEKLRRAGVTLLRRGDHAWIEAVEQSVAHGRAMLVAIARRYARPNIEPSISACVPR